MQKFHEQVKDKIVSEEYWWGKRVDRNTKSVVFHRVVTHTPAMTICILTDKDGNHFAGMSIQNPVDDFIRERAEAIAKGAAEKCMVKVDKIDSRIRQAYPRLTHVPLLAHFPVSEGITRFYLDDLHPCKSLLWDTFGAVLYDAERDAYIVSIDTGSASFKKYLELVEPSGDIVCHGGVIPMEDPHWTERIKNIMDNHMWGL